MNITRIWFIGALIVFLVAAALLISGSPLLTKVLSNNPPIPWGTPITWLGLIALPTLLFCSVEKLRKPESRLYNYLGFALKIFLLLAILWVPVSYLLSGNLSFSFSEKEGFQGGQSAMRWFWRFTYGIVIAPLLILIVHWLSALIRKIRK